jgi:hypothetical protein
MSVTRLPRTHTHECSAHYLQEIGVAEQRVDDLLRVQLQCVQGLVTCFLYLVFEIAVCVAQQIRRGQHFIACHAHSQYRASVSLVLVVRTIGLRECGSDLFVREAHLLQARNRVFVQHERCGLCWA